MVFSIPESSKQRIPQSHRLPPTMQQGQGMLGLTRFLFALDYGGGCTLNGPLSKSNYWSPSPRCPI